MDKTSIIIPCFGRWETVRNCVLSVIKNSPGAEIILIDNGTFGDLTQFPHCQVFKPQANIGYTKAINAGIALSTGDHVVFLNCDTEVEPMWLERLQDSFTETTAAVGPLSNNPAQGQGRHERREQTIRILPAKVCAGWGIDVQLSFFCIMVSRAAINDIGYLDDGFSPGYGEDDDWLYRAHLRGWELRLCKSVVIKHIGHATWDDLERMQAQGKAVERLIWKYAQVSLAEKSS